MTKEYMCVDCDYKFNNPKIVPSTIQTDVCPKCLGRNYVYNKSVDDIIRGII